MQCNAHPSGLFAVHSAMRKCSAAAVLLLASALVAAGQQATKADAGPAPGKTTAVAQGAPTVQPADEQTKGTGTAEAAAALTPGQKQLADDSAELLQLAQDLKKEVDRTDKDTLSVNVIRKAEMIEKLAKGVKQKIKVSGGAS